MDSIKKYTVAVLFLLLGTGIGYAYGHKTVVPNSLKGSEKGEDHAGLSASGLTNPLLECDLGQEYLSNNSVRPFKDAIQKRVDSELAKKEATHVSYYFRDLNNGSWFGINEKEEFSPASLLKVPLLMYVLKQAEADPSTLEAQIEYGSGEAPASQFIKPENPIVIGKTYPVKELLEHMIMESDNNAALLLTEFVKAEKFKSIFTELGLSDSTSLDGRGSMSVRDYASFFRILFNASYLNQSSSEGALTLLTTSTFKDGIVAGVPSAITVAHKFGEREFGQEKQLHDCGIVYAGKSPYLLCIMTRGSDFPTLARVISSLSKITYDQVMSQR